MTSHRTFVALAGACLLGCAGVDPNHDPRVGSPELVAVVRSSVTSVLETLCEENGLPGASAAIILDDGTEIAVAVGVASREEGTPLTSDDLLLSGSIGKTYVAALALLLARDGVLSLDQELAEYLGDRLWFARLPNGAELTLRDLLRHQSGLARYVYARAFWGELLADPDRVWTPDELVGFILDRPAAFAPGEDFAYSDTNYLLVGMAIEAATDRAYYDLVRERLLEPHGLDDTVPSDRREIPGLAPGYDELFRGAGLPENVLDDDGRFVVNPQFEWCGGGYANTPLDLARWARILYGGDAFDGSYLHEMLNSVPAPELGPDMRYGPGVMIRDTKFGEVLGHDGVMFGYTSRMGYVREYGLAIAVQTNASKPGALAGPDDDLIGGLALLVVTAMKVGGPSDAAER